MNFAVIEFSQEITHCLLKVPTFCYKYVKQPIPKHLFANMPDSREKNFIVQFLVLFRDIGFWIS